MTGGRHCDIRFLRSVSQTGWRNGRRWWWSRLRKWFRLRLVVNYNGCLRDLLLSWCSRRNAIKDTGLASLGLHGAVLSLILVIDQHHLESTWVIFIKTYQGVYDSVNWSAEWDYLKISCWSRGQRSCYCCTLTFGNSTVKGFVDEVGRQVKCVNTLWQYRLFKTTKRNKRSLESSAVMKAFEDQVEEYLLQRRLRQECLRQVFVKRATN